MIPFLAAIPSLLGKINLKVVALVIVIAMMATIGYLFYRNGVLQDEIVMKDNTITRINNNIDAMSGELEQWKDQAGAVTAQIAGFQLTLEEMQGNYNQLFVDQAKFMEEWEKKPPKTIVEEHFYTTETIKDFDVTDVQDGSSGTFSFKSDSTFSEGNSRQIAGTIPFKIAYFSKVDSTILDFQTLEEYAKVAYGDPTVEYRQEMRILAGITQDPDTKKLTVWAKTDYPNVTFTGLQGAELLDEASLEAMKSQRKSLGLGMSFGLGAGYDPVNKNVVPMIGVMVGLNVTPKKLQFGR